MISVQQKKVKEKTRRAIPTRNFWRKVWMEVPFQMLNKGDPWALDQNIPLAPPLVEFGSPVTNWRDGIWENMLKISFLPFLMV